MKLLICYKCGKDLSFAPYKKRRIVQCKCGAMNIMSDGKLEALTYFDALDKTIKNYDDYH